MARQSEIYSGNVVELRPSLKSVVRIVIESLPFLGDLFYRYYVFPRRGIACRGVYATHDETRDAILESGESDYDLCNSGRSMDDEVEREYPIRYEDYPALFWLKGLIRPGVRIVDLGGSTGGTYYTFSDALDLPADAEWLVSELPAAVDLGARVAAARGATQLRFTTQLGKDHNPDVFLTLGTIQYMSDSLPDILSGLAALPENVVVHKVPVTEGPAFWTIQGLTITEVPYYIHNRSALIKGIEDLGYTLVDSCDTLRGIRIPFHAEQDVHHYAGFFFRRNRNVDE